ncbi:helix-turn-helix domain-containing protein [Lachnospiraceae bacterium C1.1]|nr:AraC family transcriptional regulator [Lachnospiraceae bacterium C1.1]
MENFFDEIIKLNKTEEMLKEHYYSRKSGNNDSGLLGKAFSVHPSVEIEQFITEETLISENLDCSFVRHLRYLPEYSHKHEFFELIYLINGSCSNIYEKNELKMTKGDICISAPNSVHTVGVFDDETILLNIIIRKTTFERTFLRLMEEDEIMSVFFRRALYDGDEIPYLYFRMDPDEELKEIVKKAFFEFSNTHRFRKHILNACLSEFFIKLLRKHEHQLIVPAFKHIDNSDNVIYILRYLQEHYDTVTLKQLSAFFNYSERQIQRIIERATGMGFLENIQLQRMKKAEQLLINSRLSIDEISEKVGYLSTNNFRRIFSRMHKMTPKEYRKKHLLRVSCDKNMDKNISMC